VVLYEMVTGVWPFVADTPLGTAIKRLQEPPPPTVHVHDMDPRWERTILRCLARRPDDRFANVGDVVAELEPGRVAPLRWRWKTIAASVAAVAVAALIGGALYWRFSASTPLTDTDTIVLADFVNTTGDGVFDETLKQALAIQLRQSPFLSLVPDERIKQTLRLMGKPVDAPLTRAIDRELCQRSEGAAVIQGSIASLGSKYVLGLTPMNCRTGDPLAMEQATGRWRISVLPAPTIYRAIRRRPEPLMPTSWSSGRTPILASPFSRKPKQNTHGYFSDSQPAPVCALDFPARNFAASCEARAPKCIGLHRLACTRSAARGRSSRRT
jgi:eukaryotic-like serine/threonine-protein kinase